MASSLLLATGLESLPADAGAPIDVVFGEIEE